MTVFSDPDQDCIFHDTRGVLECDVCNLQWCGHIKEALRRGVDVEGIWLKDDDGNPMDMTGLQIQVPLVPELDVMSWVMLGARINDSHMLLITHGDIQGEFIGMIGPSEARGVIRDMVVAWIFEKVDTSVLPKCAGTSHGPSQQNAIHEHLRDPDGMVAEYYCELYSRLCVECQYKISSSPDPVKDGEFDSDLLEFL